MCTNVTHECIIGEYLRYDDAKLVTLTALKSEIQDRISMAEYYNEIKTRVLGNVGSFIPPKIYTLADYCDGRKSTNLIRFNFCPCCGEKIDWKKIKEDKQ